MMETVCGEVDKSKDTRILVDIWYLERLPRYREEKPYMITYDVTGFPGAKSNHVYTKKTVTMSEIRATKSEFSLGKQGFEFLDWKTELEPTCFDNDDDIRQRYYPEILKYMDAKFPEALCIHIFTHLVNSSRLSLILFEIWLTTMKRRKRAPDFPGTATEEPEFAPPIMYAHTGSITQSEFGERDWT